MSGTNLTTQQKNKNNTTRTLRSTLAKTNTTIEKNVRISIIFIISNVQINHIIIQKL